MLTLSLLTSLAGGALAEVGEHMWEFAGEDAAGAWRVERGALEVKEGRLNIRDGSFPVIYSPVGLEIPSEENVLRLRLKTNKTGVATLSLFSAHTNFAYSASFRVRAATEYRDYRVYLKGRLPGGDFIYDFALKLPGNNLNASIDAIGFYEPTSGEVISILWEGFWDAEPIEAGTSNRVRTPRFASLGFLTILYFLTPLFIFVITLILYFSSGRLTRDLFLRAVLYGFAISALLFTFRMDYNWFRAWSVDRASLKGKDIDERIRTLYDGNYDTYFDFIDEVRRSVPKGARVRPANRRVNEYDDHVARSVAYYLLPVRSAPNGDFLWLYFDEIDKGITYDPDYGALMKGKKVLASGVRPIKIFASEAALYKHDKRGRGGVAP